VFLRLGQESGTTPAANSGPDHVVDRPHTLVGPLDRGFIEEDEFKRLKSDLMSEVP